MLEPLEKKYDSFLKTSIEHFKKIERIISKYFGSCSEKFKEYGHKFQKQLKSYNKAPGTKKSKHHDLFSVQLSYLEIAFQHFEISKALAFETISF